MFLTLLVWIFLFFKTERTFNELDLNTWNIFFLNPFLSNILKTFVGHEWGEKWFVLEENRTFL